MAKKEPTAPAAPAPKPEAVKDTQNDVTRPMKEGNTLRIWQIADEISKKLKRPALRAEVMEKANELEIPVSTCATQYQRWRTYNGLERAAPAPKAEKAPKAPAAKAPAAPKAPKAPKAKAA